MEQWVKDLIRQATKPIRDLASAAAARIAAVYQAFVNVFARVRRAFSGWVGRAQGWAGAQVRHAAAVLTVLRWIITIYVPAHIRSLATSIEAWTRARVAEAVTVLRAEVGTVKGWLSDLVSGALRALAQVRDWAVGKISEILSDLSRIRVLVGSLLTDPGRLARWIVAPMAAALLDYVVDHIDAWAEAVWARRRNAEAQALALAERIIDRIA